MEFIIILICIGFLYLIFKSKPKSKSKSKKFKQKEIIEGYEQKLDSELSGIKDKSLLLKQKTALLKTFASELNRNLFFDEDEVRKIIQKLANYKIS